MSFRKLIFSLCSVVCISGCATRAPQAEALLKNPGIIPVSHEIKQVEFIDQSDHFCGPATLAMAMNRAGEHVNPIELSAEVYTPGMGGSFQSDLIGTCRRHGLMAVTIKGFPELFNELTADHPVIIFENLGFSWAPVWHYALVVGFDLNRQEIILHSGHDAYFHWDLKKFERSWILGDYWGLVVLPAGELAASVNELAQSSAAVGLEQVRRFDAAERSYRKILSRWPTSLLALIGLANIVYNQGNIKEAVEILRQAVRFHPESKAARHNLTVAETRSI